MVGVYSKANVFTETWDKDFFTHSMRRSVRPYLRVGFVLSHGGPSVWRGKQVR